MEVFWQSAWNYVVWSRVDDVWMGSDGMSRIPTTTTRFRMELGPA
jgi:hypothetical protein